MTALADGVNNQATLKNSPSLANSDKNLEQIQKILQDTNNATKNLNVARLIRNMDYQPCKSSVPESELSKCLINF